jgi:hypothetical protein
MDDSDTICDSSNKKISYYIKLFLIMMVTFVVINTDVYTKRVLSRVHNAVENDRPTSYGVCVQSVNYTIIIMFIILALNYDYM